MKVEGYHIPFMLNILADSTGPTVDVNKSELDYGSVEVLKDYTQTVIVKNTAKIPAEYTAFTKNKVSVWKVVQRHGILKPDESKELEVICNADEVMKFTDTLHIIINNGVDLEVNLKAKGYGSTLYCKENLNSVDFGTNYTHANITKEYFLENRGRKAQKIVWTRVQKPGDRKAGGKSTKEEEEEKSKTGKDMSMMTDKEKKEEEELKFVFAVVPDQILNLQPKMGIYVQFRANSFQVGKMEEQF